jgi:tetratricopeptide (TPR) repeat protein
MKPPSGAARIRILTVASAIGLALAQAAFAQGTSPNLQPAKEAQQDQEQQLKQRSLGDSAADQQVPKVDAEEEAAYKTFFDASSQDADKRIQLGEDFVARYPSSRYTEAVYSALVQAYYTKQDWKNFFANADKALALKSDDASLLTMVGWVTPHILSGTDQDAGKRLDQAEAYEKKAMQVIAGLPKPADMTDDQFALFKAELFNQAHSGLGLVYFRRQNYEESLKELQQATQGAAKPDPSDLYAMGADLFNLKRYSDAADAFSRCAEIPSSLHEGCRQQADKAKTLATQLR